MALTAEQQHAARVLGTGGRLYNIVCADPPWAYPNQCVRGGIHHRYDTLSTDSIAALPVQHIVRPDAVLLLWTTARHVPDALRVMGAWGFAYRGTFLTWVKLNPRSGTLFRGSGRWTRGNAEMLLFGTRGRIERYLQPHTCEPNVVVTRRLTGRVGVQWNAHSRKPFGAVDKTIRTLLGELPRVELFSRTAWTGWDAAGNQQALFTPAATCVAAVPECPCPTCQKSGRARKRRTGNTAPAELPAPACVCTPAAAAGCAHCRHVRVLICERIRIGAMRRARRDYDTTLKRQQDATADRIQAFFAQ